MRNCILCQSNTKPILDLKDQALANGLLDSKTANSELYPLVLSICPTCRHLQLTEHINPQLLFSHYLWVTGTSQAANQFSQKLYEIITSRQKVSNILEIASNDGTFLKPFSRSGVSVLGIDPAANLCDIANKNGIRTKCEFFSSSFAYELLNQGDNLFDVILARNVIAHTPDPIDLLKGISSLLSKDGYAYVEFHDAYHILNTLQYDSIYHEHYSYFHLATFSEAAKKAGLYSVDVIPSPISGGALIVVLSKRDDHETSYDFKVKAKSDNLLGISSIEKWIDFSKNVSIHSNKLNSIVNQVSQNSVIYGYGSSARSNTLLSFSSIDFSLVEAIIDNNPLKQGKFTPGTRIPIVPISQLPRENNITILLLAWNFSEEIIKQLKVLGYKDINIIQPLPGEPSILGINANE